MHLSALLICVIVFCFLREFVNCQQPVCPCNFQGGEINSRWGAWVSFSQSCLGTCGNTTFVRKRTCLVLSRQGAFVTDVNCDVRIHNACDRCVGTWTEWGAIGECTGVCGPGVVLKSRLCLIANSLRNFRTTQCNGSLGVSEQTRNSTCQRMNNCPPLTNTTEASPSSTTTSTSSTSTSTTSTTESTTTTIRSQLVGTRADSSTTAHTPAGNTTGNTKPRIPFSFTSKIPASLSSTVTSTHSPGSDLDTVTLAAVLGSVAMVCVTAVAIATAVVFLKRKKSSSKTPANNNRQGGVGATEAGARRSEEAAITNTQNGSSYMNNLSTSQSLIVDNTLYEVASQDDRLTFYKRENKHTYLQPSIVTLTAPNEDNVYFAVDDAITT